MTNPSYLSLYAVLDADYLKKNRKPIYKSLIASLKGGATCVQLRSKDMEDREYYETALECKKICEAYRVPFIINDRVDIAVLIKAEGIHVGNKDLPYAEVKKLFKGIIGVSADSTAEALSLDRLKAAYIGVGPVFPTSQKDKKAMGAAVLKKLSARMSTPLVAIGGINEYNIPLLKKSGIRYFSFISGIFGSKNITAKTKKVSSLIYRKEK